MVADYGKEKLSPGVWHVPTIPCTLYHVPRANGPAVVHVGRNTPAQKNFGRDNVEPKLNQSISQENKKKSAKKSVHVVNPGQYGRSFRPSERLGGPHDFAVPNR
jgi:hypothetical protein